MNKADIVIYVGIAATGYVSTVTYDHSAKWWAGLASACLITLKAKRSLGKGQAV